MKKFTIHYDYYAMADITVVAETKEEALKEADQIEIPLEDFDFDFNERYVLHEDIINPENEQNHA